MPWSGVGKSSAAASTEAPRPHRALGDSTLNDGTVLVSGGSDNGARAKTTAEIYGAIAATFTATGSMNAERVWHTSTVLQNGKVLITGGSDNSSVPMTTAELYQ